MNVNFVYFAFFQFFTKLIYPFLETHVHNLSGIFLCPEFVRLKISVIFHVQNLSSWFVRNMSSVFPCPEFVQVMCTNSGHEKIPGGRVDHFLGHFPDIPDNF